MVFRRSPKLKKFAFVLSVFIIILGGMEPALSQLREHPPKQDLNLELSTSSDRHCAGVNLPLELKITNDTNQEIKIKKLDIWRQFHYQYIGADGKRTEANAIFEPDWSRINLPENIITLKPKESYGSKSEFFEKPRVGKYALRLLLDSWVSNELEFEVINCN